MLVALSAGCDGSQIYVDGHGSAPFRDEWRTEVVTEFPDDVRSIHVGGQEHQENFANRGDVIVRYGGPPGQIRIELRRFVLAVSEESASDFYYSRLHLWAYATDVPPLPPDSVVGPDCTEGWLDGCRVRVWFDASVQPVLVGADIRITLPVDYRQATFVETSDHDADEGYPDRSNVCLQGLNGTAQVRLESGLVRTLFAPSISPAPSCSAAQVTACEQFTKMVDGQEVNAAWDPDCPCEARGSLDIETLDGHAANVTMEVGSRLWATVGLQTEAPCKASVDIEEFAPDDPGLPEKVIGEMNRPSDYATDGGFKITARSNECSDVSFVEDLGSYDQPPSEKRGNLVVCEDCLAGADCEALLSNVR